MFINNSNIMKVLALFVDDSEIKPVNGAMSSDVSDSIFKQEIVDSNIKSCKSG